MMKLIIFLSTVVLFGKAVAGECPTGQYFVSAYDRDSYYRTDGTFVSSTKVEAHCRKYHFSSPLKLTFQNTMPDSWPNQLELFKSWTPAEKREINKAINSLPKILRNLGEIKIYRAVKSSFPDNHASSGPDDSIIVLYDGAKKFGYRKALAHEMAHILYSRLDREGQGDYQGASEWREIARDVYNTPRKEFSEQDGALGPEEDFANNIEHLITNKNYSSVLNKRIIDYISSLLGMKK
ncbi:MAG: hypothetical protein KBD76_01855 [Bacteriovorax sp.]|nr:hypothetical protein [Bacteriovorax sp.]